MVRRLPLSIHIIYNRSSEQRKYSRQFFGLPSKKKEIIYDYPRRYKEGNGSIFKRKEDRIKIQFALLLYKDLAELPFCLYPKDPKVGPFIKCPYNETYELR